MIPIDKIYNCEMMLKTGRYQTKHYQDQEEWWLFEYLKEKYKEQNLKPFEYLPLIKEEWGRIYRTRFIDGNDVTLFINTRFNYIREKLKTVVLGRRYKRVTIYRSELDYINSLPAPKWFREFLLLFVAHCRAIDQNRFEYAPIQDYIKYLSLKTKNRDLITDSVYKKLNEFGLWNAVTIKRRARCNGNYEEYEDLWFEFSLPVKSEGDTVIKKASVLNVIDNLDLVTDVCRCSVCGREFVFGNRTQRTICEACHKKSLQNRRNAVRDAWRKRQLE